MKEGWKKVKLMDNCSVTTGKNDANHAVDNGRYRFYTCASEYLYCNTYKYDGACIILPGNGANVGDVYFYEGKFDAYQRTYVIDNISPKVLPFYLYYQLQYGWKTYGVAKQYGSATNYIKIGNFKDYEFLCPNIDTQKEIVEYLDSSFAKIDKLKENAAKNLEEAKALFQSALKDALEPKEGWEEKRFEEFVVSNVVGLTRGKIEQGYNKMYPYFKMNNISNKNTLCWDDLIYVDADSDEVKKYTLQEGDFLFNTRNSKEWVGKSTVYRNATHKIMLYNNNIMRIRFLPIINSVFMCYSFSADFVKDQLEKIKKGTTNVWAIYYRELSQIKIKYPPLSEQQEIVSRLDSLNEKVNTLQQNYSRICSECDALKQSILRQVFE